MRRFRVGVFVGVFCLMGILMISPLSFAADEPATGEAATEEPAAEEPVAEEAATEEPVAEETAAEEPAAEETATEEPVAEETAAEEPAAEEAAAEETSTEEPAAEEATAEEAAAEETATEEPVAEETAAEEPVAEEAATEEAAAEETTTEEPVAEETAAEEPVAEEATTEEPMVEEAAAVGAAGAAAEEAAEEPEKAPVGKAELKESLEVVNEAVGAVTASLNALSGQQKAQGSGDDLKGIYEKFQTDLKSFNEENDNLSTTYEQMKGNMESSLEGWKEQLASISNEKIRKSGDKRRESSLKSFDNVVKEMVVINRDLSSLAEVLGDVDSYLAFDLTPAGIGELKGSLGEATKKAATIQKNIGGVQGTLTSLPEVQNVQEGQ